MPQSSQNLRGEGVGRLVIAIWAIHMIQVGLLLLWLEGWVIDIFEPEPTGQVYFALLTLVAGWEGGADGRILSYTTPQIVSPPA